MSGKNFGLTNGCGKICGKGKRRGSARECVKDRGKKGKRGKGKSNQRKVPKQKFPNKNVRKQFSNKNSLQKSRPQRERERETRGERTDAEKRQGAEDGQEAVARGRVVRSMEVELETRAIGVAVKANV